MAKISNCKLRWTDIDSLWECTHWNKKDTHRREITTKGVLEEKAMGGTLQKPRRHWWHSLSTFSLIHWKPHAWPLCGWLLELCLQTYRLTQLPAGNLRSCLVHCCLNISLFTRRVSPNWTHCSLSSLLPPIFPRFSFSVFLCIYTDHGHYFSILQIMKPVLMLELINSPSCLGLSL